MLKHTTFNSVFALKQAHLSGGLLHCLCVSHLHLLHLLVCYTISGSEEGFRQTILHLFP